MTLDSMAVNNHTRWAQSICVGNKMTVLYYFCTKKVGSGTFFCFVYDYVTNQNMSQNL